MTEADAKTYVGRHCQSAVDPVLSDADLTALVSGCRVVDSEDRLISDTDYVPTYDLTRAVVDGWLLKAAKASAGFAVSDSGQSLQRQQVQENCLKMADRWESRIVESIEISSDAIDEAQESDFFS